MARHEHAAFTCRDVLDRIKGEASGIAEQANAARRAAEAEIAERRKRSQDIKVEVDRLVGLHKRIQALVGQSSPPKELTA